MAHDLIVGDEIRLLEAMTSHKSLMFFDRLVNLGLVRQYPSGYEITPEGRAALSAATNRELPLVTGSCTCDSEECCQGAEPQRFRDPDPSKHEEGCPAWHRGPCICAKDSEHRLIEGITHLDAIDKLNDLVAGLKLWHENKMHGSAWDKHDEMLWRWIEGSEASDLF